MASDQIRFARPGPVAPPIAEIYEMKSDGREITHDFGEQRLLLVYLHELDFHTDDGGSRESSGSTAQDFEFGTLSVELDIVDAANVDPLGKIIERRTPNCGLRLHEEVIRQPSIGNGTVRPQHGNWFADLIRYSTRSTACPESAIS
jgi:hypothetical protein